MRTLSINWSLTGEPEDLAPVYMGMELGALELWYILLYIRLSSAVL